MSEWPTQNFSLQFQYSIKQTSKENKENYQWGDNQLIQYQILQTCLKNCMADSNENY